MMSDICSLHDDQASSHISIIRLTTPEVQVVTILHKRSNGICIVRTCLAEDADLRAGDSHVVSICEHSHPHTPAE